MPKPKRRPRTIPARPKLSVYTDRDMMRRLYEEKGATGITMENLVNARLRLSYEFRPGPLAADLAMATA